jgi:2-phosphosulfolactate phosphatase
LSTHFDMQIATSLLPRSGRITSATDVAVAIDVLRATSVMATALAAGAAKIVTCREVDEALELARRVSPPVLLCGERGCQPIEGFDLGNSPAEYVGSRVAGKRLVLTTTNGTRAIEAAADAARMITASFLNLTAVLESLAGMETVHLVCAGTEGEITAEDVLLAGAIVSECETRYSAVLQDDDSILARQLWQSWLEIPGASSDERIADPQKLALRLRETRGGRNLVRLGYEQDLERCAAVDSIQAVPVRNSRSPTSFGLHAN